MSDLRDLTTVRRRGILVALALELVPRLTGEALDLHGRMAGRMFRRAEQRQLAAFSDDRRLIGRTIRLFAGVGHELVAARAEGRDAFAAIESAVGWEHFAAAVEEAKGLAGRHGEEPAEGIEASCARLRRGSPLPPGTFTSRGVAAVGPLLEALEPLRGPNRSNRRALARRRADRLRATAMALPGDPERRGGAPVLGAVRHGGTQERAPRRRHLGRGRPPLPQPRRRPAPARSCARGPSPRR